MLNCFNWSYLYQGVVAKLVRVTERTEAILREVSGLASGDSFTSEICVNDYRAVV